MHCLSLAATLTIMPSVCRSDISVHWPDEPIVRQFPWTYELDLDFNGSVDIIFESDLSSYRTQQPVDNSILAIIAAPPNANAFIIPLVYGDYIGPDLETPAEWHGSDGSAGFVSCMAVGPDEILCLGLWPPESGTGYFGLRFYIDDNIHYGWVMMDFTEFGTAGGNIVGWGYETDPNIPIMAGVVPEPTTIVLVFTGVIGMLLSRAKKRFR